MISTSFIDMKDKLKEFEQEKRELIKNFNNEINYNGNPNHRFSCAMAAIYYEYKRIETMTKKRQYEHLPMNELLKVRAKMLLNYIYDNFNPYQQNSIAESLNLIGKDRSLKNDMESMLSAISKIEEYATPVINKIEKFKSAMKETYLKQGLEFKHISLADIEDGKINPSKNIENQPQNELVTGVFADSSYQGMNLYVGRAIAKHMQVTGDRVNYDSCPFAPIEEQINPQRIKLAKPVYAYSLPPERIRTTSSFCEKRPRL